MDGWTDITKLTVGFQNVANVPKNGTCGVLVFNYFVLEVYNHMIYMGTIKEFFTDKNPEIYNENQCV